MGKQIGIWVGVFGVTFLVLFLLISRSGPAKVTEVTYPEVATIASDDHVRGGQSAPAVLVEYGDFQCPGCAAYEPLVQQLSKEFGDKLTLVFRHFPLPMHNHAVEAAKYAEAAANQGKFWEMHDRLYAGQNVWSGAAGVGDIFTQYAKDLGLDLNKLKQDAANDDTAKRIERDRVAALGFSVNSTPTFFLNGKKIQPESYEQFRTFIQQAIPSVTP